MPDLSFEDVTPTHRNGGAWISVKHGAKYVGISTEAGDIMGLEEGLNLCLAHGENGTPWVGATEEERFGAPIHMSGENPTLQSVPFDLQMRKYIPDDGQRYRFFLSDQSVIAERDGVEIEMHQLLPEPAITDHA